MARELQPYEGSEHEIDLTKDWYCPYCLKKMGLNEQKDLLSCPTYYQDCDFSHANKAGREARRITWLKGYKYPITKLEVINEQEQELKCREKSLKAALREVKKQLQEVKIERINL